ncbi:MAG: UDP-N-acetylmuramate--L-alanine ligase [bacterium]
MLRDTINKSGSGMHHRVRSVHFIGIGGVGMSGIAEVLVSQGFKVSGSDLNQSAATDRLIKLGVNIFFGHQASQVENVDVVVVSSAIDKSNPEINRAQHNKTPVIPRAEMLGELMRFRRGIAVAGTHGKTTTTSLLASIFTSAKMDPTFVIGGILNSSRSNAKLGEGGFLIAEADESDGSFLLLQPEVAVVTNIDKDHLESYGGDFEKLKQAFVEFLHHLPFYGLAVLCVDDPVVESIVPEIARRVISYGESEIADVRLLSRELDGMQQTLKISALEYGIKEMKVCLNMPGLHNALNALAAVAIGLEYGLDQQAVAQGLEEFGGVGRRFSVHGEFPCQQGSVLLMDDYGHHPSEVKATIQTMRSVWPEKRLLMVFQPHRYSRTRDLFDAFSQVLSEVDVLVLTDVYSAGEPVIPGAESIDLARSIRARGKIDPIVVNSIADVADLLSTIAVGNDVLLLQGAGDIGQLVNQLKSSQSILGGCS